MADMSQLVNEAHFVLRKDVENPNADRRYKDNFQMAPVWKTGTRIRVRIREIGGFGDTEVQTFAELCSGKFHYDGVTQGNNPGFISLVFAMDPVPRTVKEELKTRNFESGAVAILESLVELGRITIPDIHKAMDAVDAKWDAEEAAAEKKRLAAE